MEIDLRIKGDGDKLEITLNGRKFDQKLVGFRGSEIDLSKIDETSLGHAILDSLYANWSHGLPGFLKSLGNIPIWQPNDEDFMERVHTNFI